MLISSRYSFLPCDPHEGFSDDDLQRLSCLQSRTEAGLAPWASWEVENSSFGHTLRDWTGTQLGYLSVHVLIMVFIGNRVVGPTK